MAFVHGSKAKFLLNGYVLTQYLKGVAFTGATDIHDTTVLALNSHVFTPGLQMASLTSDGFYDGDETVAGRSDKILSAALGNAVDSNGIYYPGGDARGLRAIGLGGIEGAYAISSPVEDMVAITYAIASNNGYDPGVSLHPLANETGAGNDPASVDNAVLTSNGGVAYLEVTAQSGTTPVLTCKIQHSTNDSTWVDLITFSTVAGAAVPTSQRATVAGTVNRYTRTLWTMTGTTPNFTFATSFTRK